MAKVPVQGIKNGEIIGGFRLERIVEIPELRSSAYQFVHGKTGARLIHLYNDDANNLFSIAFRTPVSDSTGVPHILEHSVLCGSKKFPVKDPFQEMLKGSLQTFLNAMTYPDKTVYPVSSQVEKDFYNLVDVYCDATLNPLLTENTFYQEGWHYDLEDENGPVGIKGIVYNEMKGVFSDFSSVVGREILSKLFSDTSYVHESGGDPEHIPELTYRQFKDFHRRFYHPSNSFIFIYGNLPSEKTLNFINDKYLSAFDMLPIDSSVKPQLPWSGPRTLSIEAPASEEDDGTASVICAWIVGDTTDPVAVFTGSILSSYLLSTESSPLKRALVDSGLGEDLDDLSMFDSDLAQLVFMAGLRKTKPEHAGAVLDIIINTLKKEAENGLDKDLIEGAMRQAEFSLREIIGGHYPYNLRLGDRCYRSWINGGDPFALLAFEEPINTIKAGMAKGGHFERFIKEKFLGNPHRLHIVATASAEKGKKLEEFTEAQAGRLTSAFTDGDKRRCLELTAALREQQAAPPSPEALATLPSINKSDLPKNGRTVPVDRGNLGGVQLITHPIFTSGIAYLDIGFDFCGVPPNLLPYIPLYLELLTRCGAAGHSYEDMAKRISLSTGGIDASVSCKTKIGTSDGLFLVGFIHGKALESRFGEMLGIWEDLLLSPELTNRKLVKDLLLEGRNALNSSVIHAGHSFAVTSASSRLSRSRLKDEILGGVTQLRFLDAIVKKEEYGEAEDACVKLHEFLINRSTCVVSMTANDPSKFTGQIEKLIGRLPSRERAGESSYDNSAGAAGSAAVFDSVQKNLGVEINSAVNFAARAWKIHGLTAGEKGLLFLLARNLSTGYLWDKIRVEGGAYGGSAGMSTCHPIFSCSSYRDPNLEGTLAHFTKGLEEVAGLIDREKVDQSIVGAIGKIDHPKNPHSLGLGETMDILTGYTAEYQQELRDALLGATPEDMKRIAEKVLASKESAVTVLGSAAAFDKAAASGAQFDREKLLQDINC
ncbi:MAG: insulinase family protein [Chitinispirillia bacterium]|nr:insulinase family protein [Chitinispirillia bacterium]MCL2241161.1 insulinase family protein [Chitinispirillia bacterium]